MVRMEPDLAALVAEAEAINVDDFKMKALSCASQILKLFGGPRQYLDHVFSTEAAQLELLSSSMRNSRKSMNSRTPRLRLCPRTLELSSCCGQVLWHGAASPQRSLRHTAIQPLTWLMRSLQRVFRQLVII